LCFRDRIEVGEKCRHVPRCGASLGPRINEQKAELRSMPMTGVPESKSTCASVRLELHDQLECFTIFPDRVRPKKDTSASPVAICSRSSRRFRNRQIGTECGSLKDPVSNSTETHITGVKPRESTWNSVNACIRFAVAEFSQWHSTPAIS
jgi:hypothetical protein